MNTLKRLSADEKYVDIFILIQTIGKKADPFVEIALW